jgi:hypothetical protein
VLFRGCAGCGITRYPLVFDSFKGYGSPSSLSCDLTPCRRAVDFYRAVCAGHKSAERNHVCCQGEDGSI